MSSRAPVWFEQKYIAGAILALQTDGFLTKGMAQSETNIKGITVEWKIAGVGQATVMSPAVENRPTMNADRTIQVATMADYEANEWINMTDIEKMTENEQQVAQQTAAMAIGRQYDSVTFRALDADNSIPVIGDGTQAISPVNLIQGQTAIGAQGIMGSWDWYVALPFTVFGQLLLYREFVNSQYTGDMPLMKKVGARNWMGMTIVPMPDSYFNVPNAGMADGYMWMKNCLGFCTNYDMRSRIDYVPEKKAYFAGNTMGMTAKTLLPNGIRRLRFSTSAAYVRPNP